MSRIDLSVCVSLKNRSRIIDQGRILNLFPNCVRSLAAVAKDFASIELVVADFHSNDWPLKQWLQEAAGELQVKVVKVKGDFSRGKGLNIAVANASSHRLFLCDADVLIPPELLKHGRQIIDSGKSFFPIFRYLDPDGNRRNLELASYGNSMVTKEWFAAVGGVPEFCSWGGEDDIFHREISGVAKVCRYPIEGFHHQWHPERCRHENYVNSIGSDYRSYCLNANRKKD